MNFKKPFLIQLLLALLVIAFFSTTVYAQKPGWQRKQVDLKMPASARIKAIHYPQGKQPVTLDEYKQKKPKLSKKRVTRQSENAVAKESSIFANSIDSPPIDGFVPWLVVSFTDERDFEYELNAYPTIGVVGNYPQSINPQTDFSIGIFDTGAAAHVIGHNTATQTGIYNDTFLTSATSTIIGVTGSVDAWVSFPLGLFIDGLAALEPNGQLINTDNMIGQTNVSVMVGQGGEPDLPTAIGSPLSVYFAADIRNDSQITINHNSQYYTSPDIHFYETLDYELPEYSNEIPLELRPAGSFAVQYWPCIEYSEGDCPDGDGSPLTPSLLTSILPTQSLFFFPGIDLYDGTRSAIDKPGFMFDTGAQVTVVGSTIASRLALNPNNPDFEVEIMGVTGETIFAPGFYVDSIEIPALGDWLSFTNVPVIIMNIASPEGGYLAGIIGMNLFNDLNFVFNGGGLDPLVSPYIQFDFLPAHLHGDIAPTPRDGIVNYKDLRALANAWLSTPISQNWNPDCDLAPPANLDRLINSLDLAVLANHWLEQL